MKRFLCSVLALSMLVEPALAATGPQFILLHGIRNDGTVWDNTATKTEILSRDPCALLQPDSHWKDYIGIQAGRIRDQLDANDFQDGVAIGYSLGGLVAREYLRQNPTQTRIRSLITMGTPHRGAPILENLLQLPALFYPLAFVVADAALVDFGYLVPTTLGDGSAYFGIHWNGGSHPAWAVTIVNSLLTVLYFGMLKPVRDANSTIDQKPGSAFLTTLNSNTTYQAGIRRAAIQGVEGFPELYLLGASAMGISDATMIDAVQTMEEYSVYWAIQSIAGGSPAGFAAYFSCYLLVLNAPYEYREIVGTSPNLPYDDNSDAIVPAISQVMPDAEPDDGPPPLLYRADYSNHLDHMNHPNVITALRSALSTFGDVGPAIPAAPTGVVASEAAGPNITIDWNDVAREQNYLVYRDDVWIATLPANTIHYVDTQACTTHTYVIAASNCAGTTKDPAVSSDVGSRTPVPPPAPTGVVASDCGTQSFVHVTWNDITGEDGYRVFRDGAQIAQVAQGVVSYDDATGTPNQVYAYTVKSFRVCDGNSAASAPDNGCRTVPPPTWTYISTAGVGTSDLTGVYDDRDAKMLTFGGQDFTGELADVWALFPPDTLWARLWTPGGSAAGTPSPRQRPALVYSPNLDAMLSFGGFGSAPWNGDLWWLDLTGNFISGLRWYKINSTGGPVYEGTCKAVYDPVANRMIVVSPYEGVFALSTSNYQWTQIYTGALDPSKIGTDGFQCVYDPIGDRLLVFGGTTAGGPQHTTVWAMLLRGAATWTALVTTGLSQVSHGTMVWDPENEKVMLYGGTFGPSLNADVWTLNTSGTPAWTRLTTAGAPPGARWRHAAAYDWHNDRMVISGGIGTSGYRLSDSWALTFPDFTPPAPAPEIYVDALSSDQMGIVWTNSGDDGMHGIARINDIRYAQWALDAANWDMSPRIPAGPPQAAGTPEEFWVSGLQPCTRYWVGMKVIDEAGNESAIVTSGPVRTLCMGGGGFPAGASEVDSAQVSLDLPTTVEFSRIYPNPANAQTTISYGVPADYAGKKVQVTVFDLAGRSIRSLASEAASPGRRTLHWDLRNETGSRVDNGIYYVRFTLGDITRVQRVAAIR